MVINRREGIGVTQQDGSHRGCEGQRRMPRAVPQYPPEHTGRRARAVQRSHSWGWTCAAGREMVGPPRGDLRERRGAMQRRGDCKATDVARTLIQGVSAQLTLQQNLYGHGRPAA